MEGRYPGSTYDPRQCRFWPPVFRANGYQTAQIGKWHTGTDAGWGRDWDFQIVWNRPKHPENASHYYGPEQIIDFNGEERTIEGYSTDNYTRWACDYIRGEGRDPNKPWYLWVCYGAIHGPTTPAPRHRGHFSEVRAEPPADIFAPRDGKPAYLDKTQAWKKGPNGEPVRRGGKTFTQWMQQVGECMLAVDEGVGRIMETLKETGQLRNTLVIYTSDQGFANGEHGLCQKVAPYEASYRSPLIISRPGAIPQGKYCRHPVNAPDLVVTFFAQAGIELPWKMHGRDITPLLNDPEGAEWDCPTLFEHMGQDYGSNVGKALADKKTPAVHAHVPYYVAVRKGDFKYVRYLSGGEGEELYDVTADPEELTNLASDADQKPRLAAFRRMLTNELRRCDAPDSMALPK